MHRWDIISDSTKKVDYINFKQDACEIKYSFHTILSIMTSFKSMASAETIGKKHFSIVNESCFTPNLYYETHKNRQEQSIDPFNLRHKHNNLDIPVIHFIERSH